MNDSAIADHVLAMLNQGIEQHPFHKSCGVKVIRQASGEAELSFELNDYTINSAGFLHGGVLYGLMDVCGFCAAITLLKPDEQIVTHDIHCSVLSPVTREFSCRLVSQVERRGSKIIFIRVDGFATGADGADKKIALATVTKSVVKGRHR